KPKSKLNDSYVLNQDLRNVNIDDKLFPILLFPMSCFFLRRQDFGRLLFKLHFFLTFSVSRLSRTVGNYIGNNLSSIFTFFIQPHKGIILVTDKHPILLTFGDSSSYVLVNSCGLNKKERVFLS